MIPAYILSFDGAPERLVALWAEADRLGIRFQRVAVARQTAPEGRVFSAHDHWLAWQRIAESDEPFGAVIEDDVALDEGLVPILDAEVLQPVLKGNALLKLDGRLPEGAGGADEEGVSLVTPHATPISFGSYILSRDAARLLAAREPAYSDIDEVIGIERASELSFTVAVPPVVVSPSVADAVAPQRKLVGALWSKLFHRVPRLTKRRGVTVRRDGGLGGAHLGIAAGE